MSPKPPVKIWPRAKPQSRKAIGLVDRNNLRTRQTDVLDPARCFSCESRCNHAQTDGCYRREPLSLRLCGSARGNWRIIPVLGPNLVSATAGHSMGPPSRFAKRYISLRAADPRGSQVSITLHPWIRSAIRGTNLAIQAHGRQGGPTDTMVPGSFLIRLFGDECRFMIGSLVCQGLVGISNHRTLREIRSSEPVMDLASTIRHFRYWK